MMSNVNISVSLWRFLYLSASRWSDHVWPVRHSCAFELSLWHRLQLRAKRWVVESGKPCVCDVCVTAEEAVGQQGRGIMTAPLVALLGLYRGFLINLPTAWPLAWLYLWPLNSPLCAHAVLASVIHTRANMHKDTDALCMRRNIKATVCVQT